jgi:ABC-2 type transport system permease protein
MRGFWNHVGTTLLLNVRNKQALIFGYVVPVFFLIAFGSVFGGSGGQLSNPSLAQLLTISTLGGACFGMPIAMVSERERGVWRRYRLTPMGSGWFVLGTMLARYVVVLSSALLQIGLALAFYKLALPKHPLDLVLAFTCSASAFIGIGLIIASLANSIGAVQALGQSLFLPVIMIGGVGVPVRNLPEWARQVSLFLPGRYSVDAIANSLSAEEGVAKALFNLAALLVIGAAATMVGWRLFRWESGQRLDRSAPAWVALAVGTWIGIGLVAVLCHLAPAR